MSDSKAAPVVRHREYETIYLMRPDVSKEAAAKVAQRIEDVMTREVGKLTQVETWGRRSLSYPVGRYKRAVYVYIKYVGGNTLVGELERNLRLLDDVIKFQTVLTNPDVSLDVVAVDPETVKFEVIDLPAEVEDEKAMERALGFIDPIERPRRSEEEFEDGDDMNDVPDLGNKEDAS